MQSKYQRIAEELREQINLGIYKINDVIPSESQLQKQYDVSRHTIRQAISVLVNEGYLRKEKGSGTYVDNSFKSNSNMMIKNKTIGVITTYVSDYIFPSIIRGIEKNLSENGYSLLLSSTNNDYQQEKECLEKMMQQNVQGLIIEPTKSNQYNPNLALYSQLKKKNIPIIMINASYEELDIPKIVVDDELAGFLATDFLIKKNHQNILLITKIDDLQGKYRMKGFIKACEENQVFFESENIVTYTTETKQSVLIDSVTKILKNKITGIVCYNDEIANEMIHLLYQNELDIPSDISIIGNDNSTLSQLGTVPFTTLEHPKETMGVTAAQNILDAIQTNKKLEDIIYLPKIVDRNSVKQLDD